MDQCSSSIGHAGLGSAHCLCPEAYTLDAALCAWFVGETAAQVRDRAAATYAKYQKCGLKGAQRLFAAKP